MADPLSIVAGVIGLAAAVYQSSKTLFELVDSIKQGPDEIKAISKDVRAFYSIIISLSATLSDSDMRNVLDGDVAMLEMVKLLNEPLSNARMVLGELMVKIQPQLKPATDGNGHRISLMNVKWGLSTKTKVRDLLLRLEATKSTLNSALTAIIT